MFHRGEANQKHKTIISNPCFKIISHTHSSSGLWPEIKQELYLVSPQVLFHTLKLPRESSSRCVTYTRGFTPGMALEIFILEVLRSNKWVEIGEQRQRG